MTRFRVVTVFDISQTEGDPLPEHPCQALTTASERGAWLYGRPLEVARTQGVQVREGMSGLGREVSRLLWGFVGEKNLCAIV